MNFPVSTDFDSPAWRLRAGQRLHIVDGEDESVVYNDCSGETHLLSAIAVSLLRRLEQEPADFSSLSAFIAEAWEFESDEALRKTVQDVLDELDALWLIEVSRP